MLRFNTASGKYYCNLVIRIWRYPLFEARFNTASGKYYCNSGLIDTYVHLQKVSIPQAVSTIAISQYHQMHNQMLKQVSIPQAVSTIAISQYHQMHNQMLKQVSIPQAVSTIAIKKNISLSL